MNRSHLCWKPAVLVPVVALLASGCGDPGGGGSASDGHSHAGHGHQPRNGGQLVEVGRHQFNLEVLADTQSGRLTVWVLDAHAEGYVRIAEPSLTVTLVAGAETNRMELPAIANPASGETIGDTSQFEGRNAWITAHPEFAGSVELLRVRGLSFTNLAFRHPPAGGGHAH